MRPQIHIKSKFAISLTFLLTGTASAATFNTLCDSSLEHAMHACTVSLNGPIESGDANRLKAVIKEPLFGDWFYGSLLLESPGGDVNEALAIGKVVREALLRTTTVRLQSDAKSSSLLTCVSACALVWAAGIERSSFSGATKQGKHFGIGLHRPYFSPDGYQRAPSDIAEAQQRMTQAVREYLQREQVPEQFITAMLERSSREVYWIDQSGDEFALNGRAPWFEEMMIARCGFDAEYDKRSQAHDVQNLIDHQVSRESQAQFAAYTAWRQKYNACEYESIRRAQTSFRR